MKLEQDLAQAALAKLAARLKLSTAEVAWGICDIVNENMAAAARIHIAEKGHDPREFAMVATGGAGPVHVVEVARKLQIPRVLATIAAGAGSCLGLLAAPARVDRAWSNPASGKGHRLGARREGVCRSCAPMRKASSHSAGRARERGAQVVDRRRNALCGAGPQRLGEPAVAQRSTPALQPRAHEGIREALPPALRPPRSERGAAGHHLAAHRPLGREEPPLYVGRCAGLRRSPVMRGKRDIYLPLQAQITARCPVYDRYSLKPGTASRARVILEERESTLVVPVRADVRILARLHRVGVRSRNSNETRRSSKLDPDLARNPVEAPRQHGRRGLDRVRAHVVLGARARSERFRGRADRCARAARSRNRCCRSPRSSARCRRRSSIS